MSGIIRRVMYNKTEQAILVGSKKPQWGDGLKPRVITLGEDVTKRGPALKGRRKYKTDIKGQTQERSNEYQDKDIDRASAHAGRFAFCLMH